MVRLLYSLNQKKDHQSCLQSQIGERYPTMQGASENSKITIKNRFDYSCVERVLCCKCFSCLQEECVMTSDIRKETIQRMMEAYLLQNDDKILYDPVKLMILIYVCNDDSLPQKHISKCKISPSTGVINYRTDLEFYIPQMCNYIVFHRNLESNYLLRAMEQICKLNFYYAHLYYFYMKSLEKNITKAEVQTIRPVVEYNETLVQKLREHYKSVKCSSLDLYLQNFETFYKNDDEFVSGVIKDYQTTKMEYGKYAKVSPQDIQIQTYHSIFEGSKGKSKSFESTISFFQDLFYMCEDLKNHEKKKERAIQFVKMMNENLPSTAYIPFSKNCYRLCNILKIVTSQTRLFSTKERIPVCICLQIYSPSEQLTPTQQQVFWENVEVPITLKMTHPIKRSTTLRNHQFTASFRPESHISKKSSRNLMFQEKLLSDLSDWRNQIQEESSSQNRNNLSVSLETQLVSCNQKNTHCLTNDMKSIIETDENSTKKDSDFHQKVPAIIQKQQKSSNHRKSYRDIKGYNTNTKKYYLQGFKKMFGQTLNDTKKRISKNSVFGNFASWDLLYVIVKTNDDLKQQQFAMQLVHQFDYIFKLERLALTLTTYQVLSMGPDRGIIEMVKDSVTFDSLKKTLKTQFPAALTLKDFFEIFYEDNLVDAKENFLKSLAAYCLVMYVLQAKDRHNGNILLHRNGKIFHIDFGFFLSNAPGKGIQLQKDCPFKLKSQHLQVLDGAQSSYFKKFRQLFFLGFKAIRKHQNKIIMLVKMMYTSGGMTMPCFEKGQNAITALEARINPPGVTNDLLLNEHCQELINRSLDNWATKWYDRFQYWAQGIFY